VAIARLIGLFSTRLVQYECKNVALTGLLMQAQFSRIGPFGPERELEQSFSSLSSFTSRRQKGVSMVTFIWTLGGPISPYSQERRHAVIGLYAGQG